MRRRGWRPLAVFSLGLAFHCPASPRALTWEGIRERFYRNNPSLLAGELTIGQSRAEEVTAGLRPNSVFSSILSVRDLIVPYRDRYLEQATAVRETAQKTCRDKQLAYQNLIGSYLAALNQLSQAIGQEVLP